MLMAMTESCKVQSKEMLGPSIEEWICECRTHNKDRLGDIFVLANWLSTPVGQDSLIYPFEISLNLKPDFVVSYGHDVIGIEVTKFLAEQRARAAKIANAKCADHYPTEFDFDSPARRNDDIRGMVGRIPPGLTGWRSIPEQLDLYKTKFENILTEKTRKAIVEATHSCSSFWLVVEDHHSLSLSDLRLLSERLKGHLEHYWHSEPSFDSIYFSSLRHKEATLEFNKPL